MRAKTLQPSIAVRDVMTPDPVSVHLGESLRQVAELLDENEISGMPVLDDQERVVGVISRTDLLRRVIEGPPGRQPEEQWLELLSADIDHNVDLAAARLGVVDDVMSSDPVIAKADETIHAVAKRMAEERVHRVIVVDGDRRPIGVVTTLDLLANFPG